MHGVKALLTLYLVQHVLVVPTATVIGLAPLAGLTGTATPVALASCLYGIYGALTYAAVPLGGLLADRLVGRRVTVSIGAVLIAAGDIGLTHPAVVLPALGLLAAGTGLVKANLAAGVGALFPRDDPERRRPFTIYLGFLNDRYAPANIISSHAHHFLWGKPCPTDISRPHRSPVRSRFQRARRTRKTRRRPDTAARSRTRRRQAAISSWSRRARRRRRSSSARRARSRVSVLSEEDLRHTAVHNVAEALGLLPGVNVVNTGSSFIGGVDGASRGEGMYVSIRGLNSEYNVNLINGVNVAQGQPYSRGVQLSLLPPTGLNTIVLNKASTADMDGDAIGGTVDFRTPSAFDFSDRLHGSITASGRLEGRARTYDNSGLGGGIAGEISDRLGPDHQFGLYVSGYFERRSFTKSEIRGAQSAHDDGAGAISTPPMRRAPAIPGSIPTATRR